MARVCLLQTRNALAHYIRPLSQRLRWPVPRHAASVLASRLRGELGHPVAFSGDGAVDAGLDDLQSVHYAPVHCMSVSVCHSNDSSEHVGALMRRFGCEMSLRCGDVEKEAISPLDRAVVLHLALRGQFSALLPYQPVRNAMVNLEEARKADTSAPMFSYFVTLPQRSLDFAHVRGL